MEEGKQNYKGKEEALTFGQKDDVVWGGRTSPGNLCKLEAVSGWP